MEQPADTTTTDSDIPQLTMDLPVSLSGVINAGEAVQKASLAGPGVLRAATIDECSAYIDGNAQPNDNGYAMTRFLVGLSHAETCLADFLMASVVGNAASLAGSGLIAIPFNADDPGAPSHLQVERSGDTYQVWLNFSPNETLNTATAPVIYLTWTSAGSDVPGQFYWARIADCTSNAPANMRVEPMPDSRGQLAEVRFEPGYCFFLASLGLGGFCRLKCPMPSVSVVIPTHNRAHTLGRALDSVYAQTHPPAAVIVVDDGSSDDTQTLVTQRFPQAHYLRQDNRGVSAARNTGIRAAGGEWLALLDSDDEWLPRKLERQLAAVADNPEARLCHTDEIWIRNGKRVNAMRKHAKRGGMIFQHCLPLCVISPSAALLHHSLFDDVGLFDEALPACEDYDLWLRICSRYPVLYLDEALLVKYGGHEDQLSRRYWGMDRYRIRALHDVIEQRHLSDEDRRAAIEMLLQKVQIYVNGARKRGRYKDAEEFESLAARYGQEVATE